MKLIITRIKLGPQAVAGFLLLALWGIILNIPYVPSASAAISTTTTNMISTAEGGFDSAATVGMGILVLLIAVGAILMGLRIARGRGK